MDYKSTRSAAAPITSAAAITKGLAPDGGLYVPSSIPQLSAVDFDRMKSLDYIGRAAETLKLFLTDFSDAEIIEMVTAAYKESFDDGHPAPLNKLSDAEYVMELWHGPTCAFKDLALQLLPHLMVKSAKKLEINSEIVVLVATSGDTGKAALAGFKDVDGTKIMVFYPVDGVSKMQKRQMITQDGENVFVSAIHGNFDDAQTAVKSIFLNAEIAGALNSRNKVFSSANSINFGRLVPQIIYYISCYLDLLSEIPELKEFNIVVPTGNFGNILAAYYAKLMGVPVKKLICASNQNNVLTDFITTGCYDKNRDFYTTASPSMDILISSNLERLIFDLCDRDSGETARMMRELAESGKYQLPESALASLQSDFYGGFCDDSATLATIKEVFDKHAYLIDTHTAVAYNVYEQYLKNTEDKTPAVIVSTASAYKFPDSVLKAFGQSAEDEFTAMDKLHALTGTEIPGGLTGLESRPVRFDGTVDKESISKYVLDNAL